MKYRHRLIYRLFSACLSVILGISLLIPAQAQSGLNLPTPGVMVDPSPAFVPILLKGMTIHPEDPFQFDFIIDSGNTNFTHEEIKKESEKLVKYFLASMTIPKDDLWVNLSPYEDDHIIPDELGKTELGRDMLAQDYMLKQLTASLVSPEKELGKKFWDKIYKLAQDKFGTSEIPINTFNKVWIIPESATIYEKNQTVYVVNSRLKVLLAEDYLALDKNKKNNNVGINQLSNDKYQYCASLSSKIVREIILPEIEREVNEGKNFALLRQIYHSLILSKWYKETIKGSLLSKIYIDQKKMVGVELDDKTMKDQIYNRYIEAYKNGVFNFIKEDYDQLNQEFVPKKYFSGGEKFDKIPLKRTKDKNRLASSPVGDNFQLSIRINPQQQDNAQPTQDNDANIEELIKGYKRELTSREPVAMDKMVLFMNGDQQARYKNEIIRILEKKRLTRVTPEVLFEAANNAISEEEKSKVSGKIAVQFGSMDPFTNGHLSVSLGGILSGDLKGSIILPGGITPEKPYGLSASLRNKLVQLAVEDVSAWIKVSSIRDDMLQAFMNGSLDIWGAHLSEQRSKLDIASLVWLYFANPHIEWTYLVGSDNLKNYAKKNEWFLIKNVLHDQMHADIIYFLRGKETRESLYTAIKDNPWFKELWDKGFFRESSYPTLSNISSSEYKRRKSEDRTVDSWVSTNVQRILRQGNIYRLYELGTILENLEKQIDGAINQRNRLKIAELYGRWIENFEELKNISPFSFNGIEIVAVQPLLLDKAKNKIWKKVSPFITANLSQQVGDTGIPVVVLVGKPGSGKTSIGERLKAKLGSDAFYLSMGAAIREQIPETKERGIYQSERRRVYDNIAEIIRNRGATSIFIFDNVPYGEVSYYELMRFLRKPEFHLAKIIHIDVTDETSIARQYGRTDRIKIESLAPEERVNFYNNDPVKNVSDQLKKLETLGIVHNVKNDETDNHENITNHLVEIVRPFTLEGYKSFIKRLDLRFQTHFGLAADMFIVNELAESIMEKGLDLYLQDLRASSPYNFHQSSAQNLIVFEASRILIKRLIARLNSRLNLTEFQSSINIDELAKEIMQKGLFAFANKFDDGVFFSKEGPSLEPILRQEAKIYLYAEPAVGNWREFVPADPAWDNEAASTMQEDREKFYRRVSEQDENVAIKKYWEEELPQLKGNLESFNQTSARKDVSVVITVLADRFTSLLKRTKELSANMENGTFEVNIVLADPLKLESSTRQRITGEIKKLGFPVKIIESKKGKSISTNRNIGFSESSGEYIVFLDDDVKLSKGTLPSMVNALREHPQLGATQAITYDGESGWLDRPKMWFSKRNLSADVTITNIAVGMVFATRSEIVRALPFVPFWTNFGEDVFWGSQVKNLGFYLSFVYQDDAFVIHEHITQESATRNSDTVLNSWIHHTLSYYLNPDYYDDLGQIETAVRINRTWSQDPEGMEDFFRLLKLRVKGFLDSDENDFDGETFHILSEKAANVGLRNIISGVLRFFVENKKDIMTFKNEWLRETKMHNRYALLADNVVTLTFPEKETQFGISNGFTVRIRSLQDAQRALQNAFNAMLNNGGPVVNLNARGIARAYMERALEQFGNRTPQVAIDRYYGDGKYKVRIEGGENLVDFPTTTQTPNIAKFDPELSGIYLGVDVGGTTLKLVAIVDGDVQVLEKYEGNSYAKTSTSEHIEFINSSVEKTINKLAEKLGQNPQSIKKQINGIGLSWNMPVKKEELIPKYEALASDESEKLKGILKTLSDTFKKRINSEIVMTIKNDGPAGAMSGLFFSGVENLTDNLAYLGLGTGLAFGVVNSQGVTASGLSEIHTMEVFDESGNSYRIGDKLSIKTFQGLVDNGKEISEQAQEIIESVNRGDSSYEWKAQEIGKYLAIIIRNLMEYWPLEKIYVGGGIASGKFGEILIGEANQFLLSDTIEILQVDLESRGYESAIGIAYNAAVQRAQVDTTSSPISFGAPGGIDMNEIKFNRQGFGVDIQFDPEVMQDMLNQGVGGFSPIIINLTPVNSIMPLLSLEPRIREHEYAVSDLK